MAITIKEVAIRSGVSLMTVSRCFTAPDKVAVNTRSKIEKSAKELGYIHKSQSLTIPIVETNLLAVIVPDSGNPYLAETFKEINRQAMQKGLYCILIDTGNNPERESIAVKQMLQYRVKGIFLSPITENVGYTPSYMDAVTKQNVKMVFIDQPLENYDCPLVEFDNASNAYDLTKLAMEMDQQRNFLILAGSQQCSVSNDRLQGILRLLSEANIYSYTILHTGFTSRPVKSKCLELLKTQRFSSVIALNNLIAKGAIQALNAHRIRPMVFSFDYIPGADLFGYSIPYIKHDYQEVGAAAFRIMESLLSSKEEYPKRTLIEGYVERQFSSLL